MRRVFPALVLAGVMFLAACGASDPDVSAAESSEPPTTAKATSEPTETAPATPTPTPTPTRVPGTYMLGETSEEFAGGILTVKSVEVVQEVATTDGVPLTAAEGEQLVVFHTHFVNNSNETVDLSCSGVLSWYIQVFDTEQRELAPVFDTYRIPGNPECNHQMLSGQESDWSFVFRGIADATPRVLQITDTRTYDDWIAWALTDEPLRLAED